MLGKINEIFDLHIVTIAEAAGTALWGLFQPHTRSVWGNPPVVRDEYEEWELLSLECFHTNAAAQPLHGKIITLYACQAPGGVIHALPQTCAAQYMADRVALAYPTFLTRGFLVYEGAPGLTAGDMFAVTALYRRV